MILALGVTAANRYRFVELIEGARSHIPDAIILGGVINVSFSIYALASDQLWFVHRLETPSALYQPLCELPPSLTDTERFRLWLPSSLEIRANELIEVHATAKK